MCHIRAERTVVIESLNSVGIIMTLTTIGAKEIITGEGVIHANVIVGTVVRENRVHVGGVNALDPEDMMIDLDLDLLVVEVIVEVIEKIVLMTLVMLGVTGKENEIVMTGGIMIHHQWYVLSFRSLYVFDFVNIMYFNHWINFYLQAPSATVVVKGLSQKTTEEDLYQILVWIINLLPFLDCVSAYFETSSYVYSPFFRPSGGHFVMFALLRSEILGYLEGLLLLISHLWYSSGLQLALNFSSIFYFFSLTK